MNGLTGEQVWCGGSSLCTSHQSTGSKAISSSYTLQYVMRRRRPEQQGYGCMQMIITRGLMQRLIRPRIAPLMIAVFAALWEINPYCDSLKDLLGFPSKNSKMGNRLAISSNSSMAGHNCSPLAPVTGTLWDAMLAAGTTAGSVESGAVAHQQVAVATTSSSSSSIDAGRQQIGSATRTGSAGDDTAPDQVLAGGYLALLAGHGGASSSSSSTPAVVACASSHPELAALPQLDFLLQKGFVEEKMASHDLPWAVAQHMLRKDPQLLFSAYKNAINGPYNAVYKAEIVYCCSEEVVICGYHDVPSILMLLGAIKLHLVQMHGAGETKRVKLLVQYLEQRYPTCDFPPGLGHGYVLELLQHRVMMAICNRAGLSMRQKGEAAYQQLDIFFNQSKFEVLHASAVVGTLKALADAMHLSYWISVVQLMAQCTHPLLHLWMRYMEESLMTMRDTATEEIADQLQGAERTLSWWANELGYIFRSAEEAHVQLGSLQFTSNLRVFGEYSPSQMAAAKADAERQTARVESVSPQHK